MSENIFTVSQLNYSVKHTLETSFGSVWLVGEVSNFSQPVSGHWYLTLKDETAQIRAAMFRTKNMRVNFRPQNGMQVLVRATISLYEPRGDYQIIIESMQLAGDGLLQQRFEQLKMALAAEGLFAQEHKKALPDFVKTVGIITSSSGAALQDILNILKRRDPSLSIIIYPTLVQGKEAAEDIVQMIELANKRRECHVLIVGRGGGSLEDLWCFNEEKVARAIYASTLPIISAVGHETDVTIADFVADVRAPTPSAAAELVSRNQPELFRQLQHQRDKASLAFDRFWSEKVGYFEQLKLRLTAQHPIRQLHQCRLAFIQSQRQALRALHSLLDLHQQKLHQLSQRVKAQHPKRHLHQQCKQLAQLESRLIQQMGQQRLRKLQKWKSVKQRLMSSPLPHQIIQQRQDLMGLSQRLQYAMEKQWVQNQQIFGQLCIKLESLSPLSVLARGYSVTQNEQGKALLESADVVVGEKIMTRLANGKLVSEVVEIVSHQT